MRWTIDTFYEKILKTYQLRKWMKMVNILNKQIQIVLSFMENPLNCLEILDHTGMMCYNQKWSQLNAQPSMLVYSTVHHQNICWIEVLNIGKLGFNDNHQQSTHTTLINGHVRLFFSRNKFHPTRWFSYNRLKIPSYLPVLRVGWIFHPIRLSKPTRFLREVRQHFRN